MIPILYDKSETSFTSNGLGRLLECISCVVGEERNGVYECEFQYPITGKLYNEMVTNGGIISVIHDDAKDRQPFDIYKYSAPIDGIVTFNARHISYRLSGIVVKPFTATSCALALQGIGTNSVSVNPFTFWTDKNVTAAFELGEPMSAKAILAGQAGSILDAYGKGEYKFDKFDVKLYTNRGTNSGVTIRYGKNLSDALLENDSGEYYNAIVPYWKDSDGALVTLPEWYVVQAGGSLKYCVPVDFSTDFETQPTVSQLRTKAQAFLANNTPWMPKENIRVDFVQLWNTEDYKNVAALERVQLCDTVAIYYPALGLTNANAKVIKVVYDVLDERNLSIELGDPQTTLSQAIMQPYEQAIASISEKASVSFIEQAIQAATDLISGGLGGHIVINRNANGEPEEILIMDSDDIATAVNVWRWNMNGLGHSHSGYNGPFDDIAITQEGKINASMITAGILSASLIKAGVLQSIDGRFSLDLTSGVLTITGGATINGNFVSKGETAQNHYPTTQSMANGEMELSVTVGGVDHTLFHIAITESGGDCLPSMYLGTVFGGNHSTINPFSISLVGTDYDLTLDRNGATYWAMSGGVLDQIWRLSRNAAEFFNVPVLAYKGLSVIGATSLRGDTTVGGVLKETNRIASDRLSTPGWYRVCWLEGGSQYSPIGALGALIRFNIVVYGNDGNNGNHQIDYTSTYGTGNRKFVNEQSNGVDTKVDKIRCMRDGNDFYIDVHFNSSAATDVYVFWDFFTALSFLGKLTTEDLEPVADAPSGETSLAEYSFAPSGVFFGDLYTNGTLLLPFLTKGTAIPSNADMNTYTTPGVYYATKAVASTLTNANITTVPFKLIVMPMTGSDLMQIHMADWDNCIIAMRRYNGSTWSGYRRITPVAV